MAFREPPPKAHCFTFNAPTGSSADEIIDAIEETVGPGGLETLQHQGGVKFIAAVASAAAAVKLSSRGSFVLNGASVPVAQVGPRVLYISAFRVPPYVGDATLAAALSTYGKVLAIQESQFKGRPTVGTGVRVIRMEMAKPVPNFLSVQGHRIMFDYRGIRKVCSRCGAEGHLGKTCETPRCERCEVYGHETAKCTSPCRRCSGNHVTADCFLPRSYAAAAAGASIPASIEDNDGQPDQDEVQTPLEGPRHSELSETASRSESSDSSEDEDFPPLPSTERSTTEVSASETDSSKTTSPSEHETDAADSATRESVAVNEPTDEPRPSVDRRLHSQPEQTPSPGIGRETGLAQARGYQVPRTTDASLMNPFRVQRSMLGVFVLFSVVGLSLADPWVQTPMLESCSDATDVQMSDLTITDAIIRKTVSVNFTLTINKELGEDPKVIVSLRRKDGSEIGCIEGIGSCTYKLCKGSTGKDRNVKSVSDAKCPIAATKIQKSMRAPLGFMIQFAIGSVPTTLTVRFEVINGGTTVGCQSFKFDVRKR